jgi:DnaJ-class molecular chaperone
MTKTQRRHMATNHLLADLSREFWEHREAPEVFVECEVCGGEGFIEKHQPFHDDPYFCTQHTCEACHGVGGMICEAM